MTQSAAKYCNRETDAGCDGFQACATVARFKWQNPHAFIELDVLPEVAEWMDRQRAVWSRFLDVVDEYLKEEGAK